jgi:hypothetical protein
MGAHLSSTPDLVHAKAGKSESTDCLFTTQFLINSFVTAPRQSLANAMQIHGTCDLTRKDMWGWRPSPARPLTQNTNKQNGQALHVSRNCSTPLWARSDTLKEIAMKGKSHQQISQITFTSRAHATDPFVMQVQVNVNIEQFSLAAT